MLIVNNTSDLPTGSTIVNTLGIVTVSISGQTGNNANPLLDEAVKRLTEKAAAKGANAVTSFTVETRMARISGQDVRHTYTLTGTAVVIKRT